MRLPLILVTSIATVVAGCAQPTPQTPPSPSPTSAAVPRAVQPDPQETHFGELTMLTDGGENAEAYFSFAGDRLVYQATHEGMGCDQIFSMKLDGSDQKMVSTGSGRTTCAYYYPGDDWIVYASTHLAGPDCPPVPDHSKGYVWPIYAAYDLFKVRPDGTDLQQLTDSPGYDAEATISPVGDRIVFTSMRDGDLDENRPSIMSADDVDTADAYRDLFPELCQRPQLGRLHDGRLTETPIIEPMGSHGLQRRHQNQTGLDQQLFRGPVKGSLGGAGATCPAVMGEVPSTNVTLTRDQHLAALRTAAITRLAAPDVLDRHYPTL